MEDQRYPQEMIWTFLRWLIHIYVNWFAEHLMIVAFVSSHCVVVVLLLSLSLLSIIAIFDSWLRLSAQIRWVQHHLFIEKKVCLPKKTICSNFKSCFSLLNMPFNVNNTWNTYPRFQPDAGMFNACWTHGSGHLVVWCCWRGPLHLALSVVPWQMGNSDVSVQPWILYGILL